MRNKLIIIIVLGFVLTSLINIEYAYSALTWNIQTIEDGAIYNENGLGVDSVGNPHVVFKRGSELVYAKYVGGGGSCDNVKWNCEVIDSGGIGNYAALDIDSSNTIHVAYSKTENIKYATKPVGRSWNIEDVTSYSRTLTGVSIIASSSATHIAFQEMTSTGRASYSYTYYAAKPVGRSWSTTLVKSEGGVGAVPCMYIDMVLISDVPKIVCGEVGPEVFEYVGSGGSGCDSSAWNCISVGNSFSESPSASISGGSLIFTVEKSSDRYDLGFVKYVGSGGSGCTSSEWWCSDIDYRDRSGSNSLTGDAHISYYQEGHLWYAKYVGSGGSGCDFGAWTCQAIDSTGNVGRYSSIKQYYSTYPIIAYIDDTNNKVKAAKYCDTGTDVSDICGASELIIRGTFDSNCNYPIDTYTCSASYCAAGGPANRMCGTYAGYYYCGYMAGDGGWKWRTSSPDEVCGDGFDNNCDGTIDEGCGISVLANPSHILVSSSPYTPRESRVTATVSPAASSKTINFVIGAGGVGSLSSSSCITGADGSCYTTFTSSSKGTATITASSTGYTSGSTDVNVVECTADTNCPSGGAGGLIAGKCDTTGAKTGTAYTCYWPACTINNECVANACCDRDTSLPTDLRGTGTCVPKADIKGPYLCDPGKWIKCDQDSMGMTQNFDGRSYLCASDNGKFEWIENIAKTSSSSQINYLQIAILGLLGLLVILI